MHTAKCKQRQRRRGQCTHNTTHAEMQTHCAGAKPPRAARATSELGHEDTPQLRKPRECVAQGEAAGVRPRGCALRARSGPNERRSGGAERRPRRVARPRRRRRARRRATRHAATRIAKGATTAISTLRKRRAAALLAVVGYASAYYVALNAVLLCMFLCTKSL